MKRYRYKAIFDYDKDGITVTFPDLPGCCILYIKYEPKNH